MDHDILQYLAAAEGHLTMGALGKLLGIGEQGAAEAAARIADEEVTVQRHQLQAGRAWCECVVRPMILDGTYLARAEAVARVVPLSWQSWGGTTAPALRDVRRALMAGDAGRLGDLLRLRPEIDLGRFFMNPFDAAVLARVPRQVAEAAVDRVAEFAFYQAKSAPGFHEVSQELVDWGSPAWTAVQQWRALHGPLGAEAKGTPELEGLRALMAGDLKAATRGLAKSLSELRAVTRRRMVVPWGLSGVLTPLVYLLEGSATRRKQALTLLAFDPLPGGPFLGWRRLARWVDPAVAVEPLGDHPVAVLLGALVGVWTDEPLATDVVEQAIAKSEALGWGWVAGELGATLGRAGSANTVPLVSHRSAVPEWEARLARIEQALDAPAASSRFVWTVSIARPDHPELEAREQQLSRSGWSVGRRVALTRITSAGTDADIRIAACQDADPWKGWRVPDVYVALAAHPHVFTPSGEPLTIALSRPRLEVEHTSAEVAVRFEPPPGSPAERVGTAGVALTVWEPADLEVARRLDGLRLPASQAARLQDVLERVSGRFDVADRGQAPRGVDGDPAVVVQLWPERGHTVGRAVVRPVGASGPAWAPGAGPAEVLAAVDGRAVRVRRDLREEGQRLAAACAQVPGLPVDAGPVGEIGQVLELLVALHDATPPVPVEWPKGAEVQVRRTPSGGGGGSSLSVSVKRAGDWFAATGKLVVDDTLAVPLAELAARLLDATGRFVRLDDGSWLALTESLRRKLDAVARAGRPAGPGLEVHGLASDLVAELLEEAGRTRTDEGWRAHVARRAALPPDPAVPADLRAELRPYQVDGFRWACRLAALGAGACLADDMGLGKTVVTLAVLLHRAADGPALVVAPTSVGPNWRAEAWRFAPTLRVHEVVDSATAAALPELGAGDVVVVSYALAVLAAPVLAARTWSTLVVDEAQAVKNADTQRHKCLVRVPARFRLALTGTPIENRLQDLWSLFALVNPGLLGSSSQFARRYARPIEAGDRAVQQQLHRLIAPFVLRRTKAAVLPDLPARTVVDRAVALGPTQAAVYEAVRRAAAEAAEAAEASEDRSDAIVLLEHLTRLRLAACHPQLVGAPGVVVDGDPAEGSAKLAAFAEILDALGEGNHRALVFSQFVRHLALVREHLDAAGVPYQYLDGETPRAERERRVAAFQGGEGRVFLISLRAGGSGLNLTAADFVVHLDPWWNPAVEDQATDRAHRIGQTRPVTVYRLVAKGTVEEQIHQLHHTKRDLADQLLAGTDFAGRLTRDELIGLLRVGSPDAAG